MKKTIIWIPIALMFVVSMFYIANFPAGLSEKQDIRGQFGNWFGGILNPIIATLALAGMLWAYASLGVTTQKGGYYIQPVGLSQ